MLRILSFLPLAIFASVAPALAADVAFSGPSGWSHVNVPASSDPAHKFDQWHIAGDSATTLTFIHDASTAYADALATIEKNFSDNKIKPTADKEVQCQGKAGRVVEFATGPDGHKIAINRMLVPSGSGVMSITYSRPDGNPFDADVQKSETAFCAQAAP